MKKKRAIVNIVTAIIYQIITLAVGLYLPKIYTEIFGSTYNGLIQTIAQIMALLAVFQAGIAAASIQAMFKPIAENNEDVIRSIVNHTDKQYKKMGYYFIALLSIVTVFWTLTSTEAIPRYLIAVFLIINGLSACMEYFFQAKYNVLLIANNRSYALYMMNIVLFLIGAGLKLLILLNFQNVILYQSVLLLIALLRMIVIKIYIKKTFSYLNKKAIAQPFEIKRRKDVLVSEIAGMVITSTDLVVITVTCGLVFSSIYAIYNFVVDGLSNVLSSVREGVFSGIGRTYFENKEKFKKVFCQFETLYLALLFFMCSVAILLYLPFIVLYTAKMDVNYVYPYFPIIFILMKLLVTLRIPSIISINTAGHFKQVKKYAVAEAIINLVVSVGLALIIGIYGVFIGTIVGSIYRTPLLVHYANKNILERKNALYVRKMFILSIPFLIATLISFMVDLKVASFIHWGILAGMVAILFAIIYIVILYYMEKDMLKSIWNKVKTMLKKNKKGDACAF